MLLLNDIETVFGQHQWPSLFSKEVLAGLRRLEESQWAGLDEIKLAKMLRGYGIEPKQIRRGKKNGRGYEKAAFAEAWRRYPLPEPVTPVTPVTPATEVGETDES
jgi:Protein of unknown function (DUF3631)